MTTTTTTTATTTHTTKPSWQTRVELDELLGVAAANDDSGCSPDDPLAGMDLVRQIAASVARRLPSHIERDELVSLGALGWAEARARFDATRGVPFAGFAARRIRGAILDGLRAADTLTRGERKRAKADVMPTPQRIVADADEVAAAIALDQTDASDALAQEELVEELRAALAGLPARERHIVQRHFFEEVPMKVVGAELGVSESRISQIVTAAVARLRSRFGIVPLPLRRQPAAKPAANTARGSMAMASAA